MSQSSQSIPSIGFYSVEYSESLGWIGGYLLLIASGRPLEFHCTLPIRPSRTHEILYGASLRPHLIGDAIPVALMKQAKTCPLLFCTDQPEAMGLADRYDFPVALILDTSDAKEQLIAKIPVPTKSFETPQGRFRAEGRFETKINAAMEKLSELPDIAEPFARIREAIREAQQQGVHQQAAQTQSSPGPASAAPQSGSRVA